MSLKSTLLQYRPAAILGDNEEISKPALPQPQIDRGRLREDLQQVLQRTDWFLWAYFAAVLILLAGSGWFVFENRTNPITVNGLFAADGLSLAAILALLRGTWREKFRTETLVALLPVLGDAELAKAIGQLLTKVLSD